MVRVCTECALDYHGDERWTRTLYRVRSLEESHA